MSNADTDASRRSPLIARELNERRRIAGATDWWFYPLIALCAASLILASLGSAAFSTSPTPQLGAANPSGALVFGPVELTRGVRMDDAQVMYVPRDFGVVPKALHLAVKPSVEAPNNAVSGAQLLLDPSQAASLVGVPVRVRLTVKSFRATPANGVAVRLQNGSGAPWVTAPLTPETETVDITLPPLAGAPPKALELRMIAAEATQNHGGAFTRIEVTPGS